MLESEPAPPPVQRAWEGRIRETVRGVPEEARCARCNRAFRGEWDQHVAEEGTICHICNVQAERDYVPPEDWLRRELARPVPPRKVHQPPPPEADEAATRKRKEFFMLAAAGLVTLIAVNVLPVEEWVAILFTSDMEKAEGLTSSWYWVARAVNIGVSILGQFITLYLALAWTRLLYEGGLEENWPTLLYLSVVFTILNELVGLAATYFRVFMILAQILTGLAATVAFMIKLLMISERYPLRIESGIGFILSWMLCSVLLWPCVFVVHRLVQGVVSAIAL